LEVNIFVGSRPSRSLCSVEALHLGLCDFCLNALVFLAHELQTVQVEVVLADPLALALLEEVVVQLCVLYAVPLVLHHKDQASDHAALRNSVRHWLDQIPAQPWHHKDSVVANTELQCEPGSHRSEDLLLLLRFDFLDLFVTLLELFQFCFD
jgi:hypothetical protein